MYRHKIFAEASKRNYCMARPVYVRLYEANKMNHSIDKAEKR